jgi:hypothetical protein
MNPHWPDYKALMRGDGVFTDSAIAAIIFKIKLSVLMNFIQKHQILGKASAFVWRIEYQQRGFPHTHILFWTDFDTQHIDAVDAVINARYPKNSPFFNDQGMVSDSRELIDAYQIHHHSKRCRLPNGRRRFVYPQEMTGHTRIRGHNYHFARDADEGNIVPHNPSLLTPFRAHHYLEVINSEQCIGYVLKIAQRILMLEGYHINMSFMRAIP